MEPGDLFLAYRGVSSDGHAHLAAAAAKGAAFAVVEDPALLPPGFALPWVAVTSGRAAWAHLAAEAFGNPQEKLAFLGVTGTNGKTSTVWMAGQLLWAAGRGCVTVGTLGAYFGAGDGTAPEHWPTRHTTPDPDVLYGYFAEAVRRGLTHVVMEVSSHAVVQEKLRPLRFAAGAFTSFTRDHLDFHGTMADYWDAKWRFFTELMPPEARRIFWDGLEKPAGPLSLAGFAGPTVVYGQAAEAVARARGAGDFVQLETGVTGFDGTQLTLKTPSGRLTGQVPYFARHALENFAAAAALTAAATGGRLPDPKLWPGLAPVPGRLEPVRTGRTEPQVVVDYAHTPDALEKTLQVLRPFCRGRLVVVFGCGGDRDRGKRPLMGGVAERLADRVLVTSDNPRTEEPARILDDIRAGLARPEAATFEVDRTTAIERAVTEAAVDDLVLVAGKGHETYQILGSRTLPFDDRAVARAGLIRRKDV